MSIDVQVFKETMAHWASGVTVVTAQVEGKPIGITASSLSSVSVNPPQVLICVGNTLYTHHAIQESGAFAVNILASNQLEWGMRFAGMLPEGEGRFHDIEYTVGATGSPLLPGVLGWLDCRLRHAYDAGDHTIFVGEVVGGGVGEGEAPLLYFDRAWRQLQVEPV